MEVEARGVSRGATAVLTTAAAVVLLLHLAVLQPAEAVLVQQQPLVLEYHNGTLLKGNYSLDLFWYGAFSAAQRAVIVDFLSSLSAVDQTPSGPRASPSVASWWRTTESYNGGAATVLYPGRQVMLQAERKKILADRDIRRLAAPGRHRGSISVVLTAPDVAVEGFCMGRCGSHGSARLPWGKNSRARFAYIWVGSSVSQCPGQCAWPFHQPIYGPQTPPLVAPNGDVGVDGMVINLAALLAGTVTNPFAGGFFLGPKEEPLEAASACAGIFGTGAYPGYPGKLLVDPITGASYNAAGAAGRKFLLPAMWDPETSQCAPLV